MPTSLELAIGNVFKNSGYQKIIVYDGFDCERIEADTNLLLEPELVEIELYKAAPERRSTEYSISEISNIDSTISFQAAEIMPFITADSRSPQTHGLISSSFEGFWCAEHHSMDWWLMPIVG